MAEFCCWCAKQVVGHAMRASHVNPLLLGKLPPVMHLSCARSVGIHAMLVDQQHGQSPPPAFTEIEPDPIPWEDTSARR